MWDILEDEDDDDDDDDRTVHCIQCGTGCPGYTGHRNFCSSECYEEWQDESGDIWG